MSVGVSQEIKRDNVSGISLGRTGTSSASGFNAAANVGTALGNIISEGLKAHQKGKTYKGIEAVNSLQETGILNNVGSSERFAQYTSWFKENKDNYSAEELFNIRRFSPFNDKVTLQRLNNRYVNITDTGATLGGIGPSSRDADTPEDRKANRIEDSLINYDNKRQIVAQTFPSTSAAFNTYIGERVAEMSKNQNKPNGEQLAISIEANIIDDVSYLHSVINDIKHNAQIPVANIKAQEERRKRFLSKLKFAYSSVADNMESEHFIELYNASDGTIPKNAGTQVIRAFNDELTSMIQSDEGLREALGPAGLDGVSAMFDASQQDINSFTSDVLNKGSFNTMLEEIRNRDVLKKLQISLFESDVIQSMPKHQRILATQQDVLKPIINLYASGLVKTDMAKDQLIRTVLEQSVDISISQAVRAIEKLKVAVENAGIKGTLKNTITELIKKRKENMEHLNNLKTAIKSKTK